MERGAGQQYIPSVFGRGIAQDIAFDLPLGQNRDTYIQSDRMAVNQDLINGLRQVNGDISVGTVHSATTVTRVLAVHEMAGHLYTFLGFSTTSLIRIFRDTTLIGEHADYPGDYYPGYLYVDGNPNSGELAITDNDQVPIILDVDDMYYEAAIAAGFPTTKYFTDYDKTLYEVNRAINLTQPVFRGLNEVGVGGGLKTGSYAYAYRLVSDNGDETPWSPPTPFIPVPSNYGQGTQANYVPGAKTYGEAASLNPTKYGIDIAFRIINESGYDFVELKRIPNNVGGPVEYTASPQFIRLETAISETVITIVNFTDINNIDWAPLDNSNTIGNSIIATSRTVRFYDNRLVLGGITYESRIFDDDTIFNDFSDVTEQGIAFKKSLGVEGYTDIHNQVYNKSQRLGEKYGYSMQITDTSGSRSFAIPIPDLTNFKFPERRDKFPTNEDNYSENKATAATVDSWNGADTAECYEVYDQGDTAKALGTGVRNIVITSTPDEPYAPLRPVRREDSSDTDLATVYCDTVDGTGGYLPECFGHDILATGIKIAGIDTSKLPGWSGGISILRSEPAGRVVAQGMATYALAEGSSALTKALNKVWLYSPELDAIIGDKPALFDDILTNPEDYQIQLVSPVGFFPEHYSGLGTSHSSIDFVTYATAYYAGGTGINPNDVDADVGEGDGYPTFGKWRNSVAQGTGIAADGIFSLTGATQNKIYNGEGADQVGRSKYLELTLSGNLYATNSIATADTSDSANAKAFHEPFYVVNIVKVGANVANNNIDQYKEIGHHITLNSIVGYGTGILDQSVEIISERIEDFHWSEGVRGAYTVPNESSEYTYIWVNGQRWLNVTRWQTADIDAIRLELDSASSFTQTSNGGDACETSYGIYTVEIVDGIYYIKFPYQTIAVTDIIPGLNELIEVRYDPAQPIEILLGDTVIGPASFAPIDSAENTTEQFDFAGVAFPFKTFTMENGIFYSPALVTSTDANRYSTGVAVNMEYIRQWLVTFMCESTVNLPFVYKDFFPYKNYVMRPVTWSNKEDTETDGEHMGRNNIYEEYATDYPDEHLMWKYGGFHFPAGSNFDYNKQHRDIYTELPIGVTEILDYPKRLHWGSKRSAASISRGISRSFPVTNVYDILLKDASEINILYSHYSTKGNNLYAVMDRGVVGLLTDKNVLRDGVADELGVILSNSEFIQGEIILDPWVGCPDKHWRGRAEGSIKTPQNVHIPGLVFPGDDDIYLLSGNGVVSIGTNYRDTLVPLIKTIGDSSILTSTFDHARNELWFKIDGTIHLFGFSINNWVGQVSGTNIAALANAKIYDSTKVVRIGVTNYYNAGTSTVGIYKSYTGNIFASDVESEHPVNSTTFAVTPPGLAQVEFTDIFINSSQVPSEVVVSTSYPFNDTYTLNTLKDVNGLYRATLGRTVGGNTLVGNTLYVRVKFPFETAVDLGYVKTGFKKVTGG